MNKFLITTLCMVFLIGIGNVCALEEFSPQAIDVDEFIKTNLSDYTMQKRIPLEGIGRNYAVAKESGNIVAVTEDDDHYNVYYFDIEGNELWKKEIYETESYGNLYKVKSMTCNISDNGETICLYITPHLNIGKATSVGGTTNTILSKDGSVLFTKMFDGVRLFPSPDGKYLTKGVGALGGPADKKPEFYSRDGTLVTPTGFTSHNMVSVHLVFISDNHIIAYTKTTSDNTLQLFQFENNTLIPLWEYDLENQYLQGGFYERVKVSHGKIAFGGRDFGSKFSVFDYTGNLLHLEDTVCLSFDFINDDELFLQTRTAKGKYSKLINFETKETRKEDIVFNYQEFRKAFEADGMLLFGTGLDPRKYSTLIVQLNNWQDAQYIYNHDVDVVENNFHKNIIFERYNENPELIILSGGER